MHLKVQINENVSRLQVVRVINDPGRQCFSLPGGLRVINDPGRKCIKTLPNMVEFFIKFTKV